MYIVSYVPVAFVSAVHPTPVYNKTPCILPRLPPTKMFREFSGYCYYYFVFVGVQLLTFAMRNDVHKILAPLDRTSDNLKQQNVSVKHAGHRVQ